jgi:hypothetical protein
LLHKTAEKYPEKLKLLINVTSLGTENRLNEEKVKKILEQGKLKKFWVCGNPGFVGFVKRIIGSFQIPKTKLIYL